MEGKLATKLKFMIIEQEKNRDYEELSKRIGLCV